MLEDLVRKEAIHRSTQMTHLEGCWAVGDKGGASFGNTVGKRELEVGNEKLPDVGATNIVGLLNLHNTKNLNSTLC